MADTNKTGLVVTAHPGDFVWRAGGAIALHAKKGYRVKIVCLSFGERGESQFAWKEKGATLASVKAGRKDEAERARRNRQDARSPPIRSCSYRPLSLLLLVSVGFFSVRLWSALRRATAWARLRRQPVPAARRRSPAPTARSLRRHRLRQPDRATAV